MDLDLEMKREINNPEMAELKERLDKVNDTYQDFQAAIIHYAKMKPERYDKVMKFLKQNPDASSSDIVFFVSNLEDFEEDASNCKKKKVYLIAKKGSEPGCLAVQTEGGKALAGLVEYLGLRMLDRGVEILTVSDMNTYGEYKPYHLVETEKEFICKVLEMRENPMHDWI